MNDNELRDLIAEHLDNSWQRRARWLETLQLKDFLGSKNPHLLKAIGTFGAPEIVVENLTAYLDSLDGGIFSEGFFESIAHTVLGNATSCDSEMQPSWERLASVPDFYPALIQLARAISQHGQDYDYAWHCAVNRFLREFVMIFCDESGTVDWERLIKFNCGNQDWDESRSNSQRISDT